MNKWDKVDLVQKMQDYILQHIHDENFTLRDLYEYVGYSKRHADRIFAELLNKTPMEYVRSIKLSNSAQQLLESRKTILEVALEADYHSHEGYTRAFLDTFGISPSQYKKGKSFIPLFIPYPIEAYYKYLLAKEKDDMEKKACLCMITPVQRPKRKLIFLRSENAHDYLSYCQEKGCEWEGLFNSIPAKFDMAAILTLPPALMKSGYCNIASGIEVPVNYDGEIPKDCEVVELEPCEMLYFQSQPYETQEEFFELIGEVLKAVEVFDAAAYGYERANEIAPKFNFGGQTDKGARLAIPVKRL